MIKDIGVYSNNNNTKIRLNGNESPVEINENKLTSVVEALKNIELNRYPDSDSDALLLFNHIVLQNVSKCNK